MKIEVVFQNGLRTIDCPLPEGIQLTKVENSDESITIGSSNYVSAITESVRIEKNEAGEHQCIYRRKADVAYPKRESRTMPNRYDPAKVDSGTVNDFSSAPTYDMAREVVSAREMPAVRAIYADGHEVYAAANAR